MPDKYLEVKIGIDEISKMCSDDLFWLRTTALEDYLELTLTSVCHWESGTSILG